ncbi:alpha-galactosidase [Streptomyces noursei]
MPEAVTTAELAPAPHHPLLDTVTIAVLSHTPGTEASWTLSEEPGGLRMLRVRADGAPVEIRLAVPLADAVGYWHPQGGWHRTLLPDWEGRAEVSLVDGHAAGCLYDHSGATMLAFAAADPIPPATVRFGVSEENDSHVVHIHLPPADEPHRLLLVPRAPSVAAAMRALRGWFAHSTDVMPVPDTARVPVYSTWYAFNQGVSAEAVEAQAERAAELGCGVLILDDGWQEGGHGRGYAGCGDWKPDPAKFPDFTAHVRKVQGLGLRYLAWVAPLLLGPDAECHTRWAPYATVPATVPGARVLDPRRPEVRRHVIELCAALVRDHGLDGLKLDFLDEARVYAGDGGDGVGQAMVTLLAELRETLSAIVPDVLLELRQPYVGPGMAPFGNMLRSFDCPADAVANRVRTIDTSFLAVDGAVHSDMLMWSSDAPVETVARQLISVLHSVPQISVRLDELPTEHLDTIAFWLRQWGDHRELLLDADTEPGRPDELYQLISTAQEDRCLLSVHGDRVVSLDLAAHRRFTVVNGSDRDRVMLEATGATGWVKCQVRGPDGHGADSQVVFMAEDPWSLRIPRGGLAFLTVH